MDVNMIDDIFNYEETSFMGMTTRQLVFSILGVAIVAAGYFLTTKFEVNSQLASYLSMGLGIPCFLFGFLRPHKMKLEKFLAVWIRANFLSCRHRVLQTENLFYETLVRNRQEATRVDVLLYELDKTTGAGIPNVYVEVFRLQKKQKVTVWEGATNIDGVLHIPDLAPGTYYWTEQATPGGYFPPAKKAVCFKVHKDGKISGRICLLNKPYVEKPKRQPKPVKTKQPKKDKAANRMEIKDGNGNIIGYGRIVRGKVILESAANNESEEQ